ncbi:hypothetical protein X896_6285 [Burkholderia pseudomallei ABCPW 1]|nr:hypothetical protein Y048_4327 [Burkholderia pseudomallei MSHR456]KGX23789.1 hypothetical protein X896_6285 [Burkholderia pseudomallei ABCPW 1]
MLVCTHDGRIDQYMLDLGFVGHGMDHTFPHTLATPSGKRMYTVCHRPNAFGKSRHGQPVRPIQRTASTNQRLSAAVLPGSPSLPGKTDSIRAHTLSLSNVRIILTCSRKRQDVNTFHRM